MNGLKQAIGFIQEQLWMFMNDNEEQPTMKPAEEQKGKDEKESA